MGKIGFFLSFLLFACGLFGKNTSYQNTLEELRIALMDLRKSYSEQKVELEILQEKMNKTHSSRDFENRLSEIEKTQEKILSDLKQLSNHAHQTEHAIALLEKQAEQASEKIAEVVKLKSTLNSISKAMGTNHAKIHKVSSGDSLEKIARKYNTTVENVKQANGLTTNTIIIGQELKIP